MCTVRVIRCSGSEPGSFSGRSRAPFPSDGSHGSKLAIRLDQSGEVPFTVPLASTDLSTRAQGQSVQRTFARGPAYGRRAPVQNCAVANGILRYGDHLTKRPRKKRSRNDRLCLVPRSRVQDRRPQRRPNSFLRSRKLRPCRHACSKLEGATQLSSLRLLHQHRLQNGLPEAVGA